MSKDATAVICTKLILLMSFETVLRDTLLISTKDLYELYYAKLAVELSIIWVNFSFIDVFGRLFQTH